MNEFENVFLKYMLLVSSILGILLLVIAGVLIIRPGLLLQILKTVTIALCAAGGISLLAITVISGIKYTSLRKQQ